MKERVLVQMLPLLLLLAGAQLLVAADLFETCEDKGETECEEEEDDSACAWNTGARKCVTMADLSVYTSENPYPGPELALSFVNSTTGEIVFPNGPCQGEITVTYDGLCGYFNALPSTFSRWKMLTGADVNVEGNLTSYCNDETSAPFIPSFGGVPVNSSASSGYFGVGGYWIAYDDAVLESGAFDALFPAVEKLAGLLEFSVTYSLADLAQRLLLAGFLVQDIMSESYSVGSIECSSQPGSIDVDARVFLPGDR